MPHASFRGFTLVELIIVIVILGILAVTAAPRLLNLSGDAYASTMRAVQGAINDGKQLAFSKCITEPTCDASAPPATGNGLGNSITVQGESITLAFGYPRHTAAGIARMINISDVDDGGQFEITSFTSAGRPGIRIRPNANYAANECEIRYSQPLAIGELPLIESELDGC
ncbi:prepilin-type N-terminal cleavage/methylation domain-containing protein [Alteromonas sp. W364]|uniref:prepilin-type N-terminal cleavage/methylation domain-containing protein n=1 Tax=Alteromonas sp. W364 TaxID=3075610 RepID=UPI0028847C01|nr:prepilin-type N-terminal cleavage/methylation domain-containing protein [Alteromonas sp. W364]MDT0629383.1 prepilin-type N-terminal cleavage/methylation domain-containing protein [Alteromonas sp. W364]